MPMFVLQVQSGYELQVKKELNAKGYLALVPQENRLERSGGKWHEKLRILMPSYVFVSLCFDNSIYYDIKGISHIIRFLGGVSPTPLADEEADYIKLITKEEIISPSTIQIFSDGRVKPVLGLLAQKAMKITAVNKRQKRVKVEISLLNKKYSFQLSAYIMEALI